MKKRNIAIAMIFALVLSAVPSFAQMFAQLQGKVKDEQGQPIADAQINIIAVKGSAKYTTNTNKKGEYIQVGIRPDMYNVVLSKDGKELWKFSNVDINWRGQRNDGVTVMDFDLKKEYAAAQAQGQPQMTEEQKKQAEAVQKENTQIKGLNDMIAQAKAASEAGNNDQAVQIMTQATQLSPNRDLLWFYLGEYQRKAKQYEPAVASYQKAIELRAAQPNPGPQLADYQNNYADALYRSRKADDAVAAYQKAAEIDPTRTSMFLFNAGAVLVNSGRIDEAIKMFDTVIAKDPNYAEAYYQKGVSLLGKAELDSKTGKMKAPDGTAEAFNKYLELTPTGPNAEGAKQMLSAIGAEVDTKFKRSKK